VSGKTAVGKPKKKDRQRNDDQNGQTGQKPDPLLVQ
jgi:hypothetical protein